MRRFVVLFIACLIPVGGLFAAEDASISASTINPASLYTQHCAICHGDNGDANTRVRSGLRPLPRDFTTVVAAMELTRERMIESVANGRPGTGMMPHKDRLTAQEIESIVDYIRAKFMRNPGTEGVTVKDVAGEKIYTRHCSVCHGDKGNTAFWARNGLNPPPRNFTDPRVRQELSRERMLQSVLNGRPGTGMMPFSKRLSQQEIQQVVDYIRTAFMQPESSEPANAQADVITQLPIPDPQAQQMPMNPHQGNHQGIPAQAAALPAAEPADMSLPFPNNLQGDLEEGRRFFMANCFTCHGVTGNGQGPRAYFNTPRPRDFTNEVSRRMLNRVRLHNGIKNGKTGTVMPAWGKVLTDQQIANVAEFVFQAFIQVEEDAGMLPAKKNR